ncbi:MAG: bifunctional phosphoribosylaminoimidazolecarboxamide formyltransferase/IMP cyclohydrolase [Pirellulaceae bacterium]|nr:bifunctional phosphoribosylaminoimidazolecarboxamide formyltransferase/IMP cyclohydrolase [Pirellulaceae bacterium]
MDRIPTQRAIISVSDKTGLDTLARGLAAAGVQIFSTGGTRAYLEKLGLAVTDVAAYTGFPEMMHGRVKTLHPKVFGGILCRRDEPEDLRAAAEHGMALFDLVVVNLYPFTQTVAKPGVTPAEAIENIDIGGPSLVRAAAKNHAHVAIATSPAQYEAILAEIATGGTTLGLRQTLAGAAYAHTATYDTAISGWFQSQPFASRADQAAAEFPANLTIQLTKQADLRYGENSHQKAAVYVDTAASGVSLVRAEKLNGKELSYNNLLDLDNALSIVRSLAEPAAAVIKHNNPCGAATAADLATAAKKALDGDPLSAFGGVLAFNREVDLPTAELLATPGLFIEAIVAPRFDPQALQVLTTKPKWKANVRLLAAGPLGLPPASINYRHIEGGMLVQQADVLPDPESEWKVVTGEPPTGALLADLRFAWSIVRHVKSNAIVLAKGESLLGCGAGQMSRVDSVEIAIAKAGPRSPGSVLASDAFFPFADSIPKAAAAGVVAIIQPGGSVRDDEVIAAAKEHRIPMIFTGRRHFKH